MTIHTLLVRQDQLGTTRIATAEPAPRIAGLAGTGQVLADDVVLRFVLDVPPGTAPHALPSVLLDQLAGPADFELEASAGAVHIGEVYAHNGEGEFTLIHAPIYRPAQSPANPSRHTSSIASAQ